MERPRGTRRGDHKHVLQPLTGSRGGEGGAQRAATAPGVNGRRGSSVSSRHQPSHYVFMAKTLLCLR
jgi:hypothetical protein